MRRIATRVIPVALFAAPLFIAQPATAQEEAPAEVQACEATLTPNVVSAGETPTLIRVALTEEIGFHAFEAPEESGLSVVEPEDVPREEMAAEGETPQPISMADEANTFLVWLNTSEATQGTYEVALIGENGTCTATIEVEGL